MDKLHKELIKKYSKDVDPKILKTYKPAEKYIIFNNNDPDLYPIKYKMPEPPPYHLIDGFGKPASEQVFVKEKIPEKLVTLQKRVNNMNKLWTELDDNRSYYANELAWIYKQWWHRLYGYWFFNNGVPTFITGVNWFWLNWWKLNAGYPKYYYRDRMFFLFTKYCMETTTATFFFRIYDDKKKEYVYFSKRKEAEKFKDKLNLKENITEGEWEIDYGKRICYGFNYPKHRREGATSKATCINFEMLSRTMNEKSFIQSMDRDSAKDKVFSLLKYGFKNMPFFFMPQYQGSTDPRDSIEFAPPSQKIGSSGSIVNIDLGLESSMAYTNSADLALDGERLLFRHGDEDGKLNLNAPYNAVKRWDVSRKTLQRGDDIFGFNINTSTSGDTRGEGGKNYRKLCSDSHWEERNYITGKTKSGLFNFFTSVEVNYSENFSDRHGNPIIERPTKEQQKDTNERVGAREALQAELDTLENNPSKYNQQLRDFPRTFREAFMSSAEDSGFNLKKLTEVIATLEMDREYKPLVGDLVWKKQDEEVEFVENMNGKFIIVQMPTKPNNQKKKNKLLFPANDDVYVAGTDPAKFEKKSSSEKKSLAAAAVFRRHDPTIDSEGIDPSKRMTHKFVALYSYDVLDFDTYYDDIMKLSVFYGVSMFPEYNTGDVEDRFKKRGFKNYLKYRYVGGRKQKQAGVYTDNNYKQQIFTDYMNYIENYADGEKMLDLLYECRDIEGIDNMTHYDKFTAGGLCFLSLRNDPPNLDYYKRKEKEKDAEVDSVVDYIIRSRNKKR